MALCGANSVNWILTFFAIQKIGAVAVLLNSQLTSEEITVFSKRGDITHFCLGNTPIRNRKQFSKEILDPERSQIKAVLDVGDEIDFLKKPVTEFPDVVPMSDDICVIIFTSGSTATPKGVQLFRPDGGVVILCHQRIFDNPATQRETGRSDACTKTREMYDPSYGTHGIHQAGQCAGIYDPACVRH